MLVAFTVDRNGRLVNSSVYRTNGDDEAEATALASLRRSSPLPAPPSKLLNGAGQIELFEGWMFNDNGQFQLQTLHLPQATTIDERSRYNFRYPWPGPPSGVAFAARSLRAPDEAPKRSIAAPRIRFIPRSPVAAPSPTYGRSARCIGMLATMHDTKHKQHDKRRHHVLTLEVRRQARRRLPKRLARDLRELRRHRDRVHVYVYATTAALVIGPVFFPHGSPAAQVLSAFVTFGIAFFARPIGSFLFGHFGDRVGRKSTLVASLLVMGMSRR